MTAIWRFEESPPTPTTTPERSYNIWTSLICYFISNGTADNVKDKDFNKFFGVIEMDVQWENFKEIFAELIDNNIDKTHYK